MKGKLERPEPKAAAGPGQGEAVPGGQGVTHSGEVVLE